MNLFNIKVSDIMRRDVVTCNEEETLDIVSRKMFEKGVGSIIVTKEGKPVGIITERDICYKVVSRNLIPSNIRAKDVMSKPLISINSKSDIYEAIKIMKENNIRRLPVIDGDKLLGIITERDLLSIIPEIITILSEYFNMRALKRYRITNPTRGTCEICGAKGVRIYYINGQYVCESCKDEIGE